jgi:hypothetical protein
MRTVERFVTAASPDIVWQILADVERWRDWTPTILEVEPLTDGGLRIGARYRVTQPRLRPAVYEVTQCIPNEAFTWVQRFPGGEMVAEHRMAMRNPGTEVDLLFCSKGFLANVVSAMFSKMIRDHVATEARSLRQRCESLMKS